MAAKVKRGVATTIWSSRTLLGIALVMLALVLAGIAWSRSQPERHCVYDGVTIVESGTDKVVSSNPGEVRCFSSFAEAVNYATDGAVVLPVDSSNDEVNAALSEYYSER